MTNKQANILFIPTSIGGYSAEHDAPSRRDYYQQLIYSSLARCKYTIHGFRILGQELAGVARHAYLANQMNVVEQATDLMCALPIANQFESIARYYQALCTWQRGDRDGARRSLERVVEESPTEYKARAFQIIGLTYHECGEVDAAFPFYVAAGKLSASSDWLTLAESQQMSAVVRSIRGDHKGALADLERLFPLLRVISKRYPPAYYTFLNHLAVELGEVGHIAEAEAALSIALASPFATAYPEWSETRDEIAAKRKAASPSVVAVRRVPEGDRAHEAHSATDADRAPEVVRPTQPKSLRKPEASRPVAFSFPSNKDFFQRSTIQFPARTTTAPNNAASIFDRVLICVGPRAPPSLY